MDPIDLMVQALQRLTALETLLKSYGETRDRELKEVKCVIKDHEARLRPLESQRNKILGLAAGCGFLGGAVVKMATMLFTGHFV